MVEPLRVCKRGLGRNRSWRELRGGVFAGRRVEPRQEEKGGKKLRKKNTSRAIAASNIKNKKGQEIATVARGVRTELLTLGNNYKHNLLHGNLNLWIAYIQVILLTFS